MLPSETRRRLQRLAEEWTASARRTADDDARSAYWRAANEARGALEMRYISEHGLRAALRAAESVADLAACLAGEHVEGLSQVAAVEREPLPAPAPVPATALNARRLAQRTGMPERSARHAIERSVRRGLPGFYRDGCHLYAEPHAFDGLPNSCRKSPAGRPRP